MFNSGKFLACCVYIATLQVELLMLTVVDLCSDDARRCSECPPLPAWFLI